MRFTTHISVEKSLPKNIFLLEIVSWNVSLIKSQNRSQFCHKIEECPRVLQVYGPLQCIFDLVLNTLSFCYDYNKRVGRISLIGSLCLGHLWKVFIWQKFNWNYTIRVLSPPILRAEFISNMQTKLEVLFSAKELFLSGSRTVSNRSHREFSCLPCIILIMFW